MSTSDAKRRYESMLFNYETTGRTDFRDGSIRPTIKSEYKPKSTCLRIRPPPLKDVQALTDWRKPIVPFDLMHKPKDVVRTNPTMIQQPFKEPEDLIREEVQNTRPRLVMTPAVSLDDIEPTTRKVLIDDIYTTTFMKMTRESGVGSGTSVHAPLPDRPAPANPITLPYLLPSFVSPEWRMASATWDGRQLRTFCDPTQEFWLAFDDPKCNVCDETAEREALRKMRLSKRR